MMINTIRRFLTTPSTVFEFTVNTGANGTIQQYAIKRLAQSIQTRNDGQAQSMAQSALYTLLNHITMIYNNDPASSEKLPYFEEDDTTSEVTVKPLTDHEKHQVCTNVISAIAGVAVHLKDDKITESAFSILAQRRRFLVPVLEVVILDKLIDLALAAPRNVFTDVVTLYANISKKTVTSESKAISTAVLNCQNSLAHRINKRPDLYDLYLHNLLDLFVENVTTFNAQSPNNRKSRFLRLLQSSVFCFLFYAFCFLARTSRPKSAPRRSLSLFFATCGSTASCMASSRITFGFGNGRTR